MCSSDLVWFVALAWGVAARRSKFTERTLLKLEHGSGVVLLVLAGLHGAHIVWEMSRGEIQLPQIHQLHRAFQSSNSVGTNGVGTNAASADFSTNTLQRSRSN